MELSPKTLLQGGKYKIIEKIGQGGFGIAYRAIHQGLQTEVCIKEFFYSDLCERSKNSSDITIISKSVEKIKLVDSLQKKFTKEAQRLAKFQHPNIVQVTDNFNENNTAYFVMEFLDGGSLEDLLKKNGALSEQKAKALILPILDAMDAVHKKDLLHLDIKPANIMLRKNQSPVLIDFGISKYLETANGNTTTAPIGISKGFASLEQYGGNISDFSKATDIYSLCATIYNMVTGVIPPEPLKFIGGKLKSPLEYNSQFSVEFNNAIIKGMSVAAINRQQGMSDLINLFIAEKDIEINFKTNFKSQQNIYKIKKYLSVESFSEGLAVVHEGKYGYIDKTGHEVIPLRYEEAYNFENALAIVKLNGKYGYIDKTGREVISCKYDGLLGFSEELAPAWLWLDRQFYKKKYGFVDKTGREVIPFNYDNAIAFKEGLALVNFEGKYGYIDKTGREVITCRYEGYSNSFNEGLAMVGKGGKYGYIDKSGHEVIPLRYEEAYDFDEGLAMVLKGGKYGYIDKSGREVIPCRYENAKPYFREGLFIVKSNGKYGYIDKNEREVIPLRYEAAYDFNEGLAMVKLNGKYGYIDKTGYEVIPCRYAAIYMNFKSIPPLFKEGLAMVTLNEKLGYIDKNGSEVIICKYKEAKSFSEGLACVELNRKWSYIDKSGQVVLE